MGICFVGQVGIREFLSEYVETAPGDIIDTDKNTGIHTVKSKKSGRLLKIADLVEDSDLTKRDNTLNYLRNINSKDDIEIIIAIGMAKEGFDWVYCEVALTIGYRNSFTEIIQIIGVIS